MSDRPETPSSADDLTEVAAGWLAALDTGSADVSAFEAWRDADPRHAAAFAEVAATWRELESLKLVPADLRLQPHVEDRPAPPSRRHFMRGIAVAGAIAVAGGGVSYSVAARDKAVTRVGERRAINATSDVAIDLNTDSCIYWKGGQPARVWLERGEIAIRATGTQGVRLLTPGGEFALLPGAYNARLRGGSCELAVLTGAATFDKTDTRIRSGDIAVAAGDRIHLPSPSRDLSRVTAWQNDTLVLNGESLDYALAEMNRYLPNKIVIGDPDLSRLRLGGTFATSDPSEFLRALRTSFGVRATVGANGGVVLTRA